MNLRYLKNDHDPAIQDSVKRPGASKAFHFGAMWRWRCGDSGANSTTIQRCGWWKLRRRRYRPSLDEKTRSITVPVVVPASRSEGALRRTRSTPSPDLADGRPRRSPPSQSPLAGSSPSAASATTKTTGRLLRSPHRTPLPSSHFAADGQSARPSASFAPPPALGCSCHHYAPVNSLRAGGVHRMLTDIPDFRRAVISTPFGGGRPDALNRLDHAALTLEAETGFLVDLRVFFIQSDFLFCRLPELP